MGTVSLDAPAILHESYMRIEGSRSEAGFPNRKAFFTYASAVIRTVIIDYVRERLRLLYVGITRAKKELVITWNTGRRSQYVLALPVVALQNFWEEVSRASQI